MTMRHNNFHRKIPVLQGLLCKPCKNRFLSHCSADVATWPRKFIPEATVRYRLQMLIRRSIRSFTIPPLHPPFAGKFEPCASVITLIMNHQIFLLARDWSKTQHLSENPLAKTGWHLRLWSIKHIYIKFVPENTHKKSSLAVTNKVFVNARC